MNGELPDGGFSIESLGEDTAENARQQLSLLEKSLGSAREPAETAALLDEAYRAAHSLKSAVDSRRMPNVDRLARRVQDVVRATRSGVLAVTPATVKLIVLIPSPIVFPNAVNVFVCECIPTVLGWSVKVRLDR